MNVLIWIFCKKVINDERFYNKWWTFYKKMKSFFYKTNYQWWVFYKTNFLIRKDTSEKICLVNVEIFFKKIHYAWSPCMSSIAYVLVNLWTSLCLKKDIGIFCFITINDVCLNVSWLQNSLWRSLDIIVVNIFLIILIAIRFSRSMSASLRPLLNLLRWKFALLIWKGFLRKNSNIYWLFNCWITSFVENNDIYELWNYTEFVIMGKSIMPLNKLYLLS